ncbi:hypothetical protein WMO40_18880 [Bacillaceae bacterium CLA-AA-H227]|uniref:Uncharacterized protein n=1 Tax=Robertmurraya yapensis (ex Hitch et al 2024) TaxID=3133160 RepID=A0ACC6SI45_9BACI
MSEEKTAKHPVEYNYIPKHNPYFSAKIVTLNFKKNNSIIRIEFDNYYDDAEKLRDDIVAYIRNEKGLACEAIDVNHYLIGGERYVLNVSRTEGVFDGSSGQSTILYREEFIKP